MFTTGQPFLNLKPRFQRKFTSYLHVCVYLCYTLYNVQVIKLLSKIPLGATFTLNSTTNYKRVSSNAIYDDITRLTCDLLCGKIWISTPNLLQMRKSPFTFTLFCFVLPYLKYKTSEFKKRVMILCIRKLLLISLERRSLQNKKQNLHF